MSALVVLAFLANAFIYSGHYKHAIEDWQQNIADTTQQLEMRTDNLLQISSYIQRMVKPPSVLAFIADGGEDQMPNKILVNAFIYQYPSVATRGNDMFSLLPNVDWVFIVGALMSLTAILLGFSSIAGEKRDGTLAMILSNPVSRLSLFLGKYIGLLIVMIITLLVGAGISLVILTIEGVLPLTTQVILSIAAALLISILCISFVLLSSMAVSSMAGRPAVALVILMVFWLLGTIAIPGMARLFGEKAVTVTSPFELEQESNASFESIWYNAPKGAGTWKSAPSYAFTEAAHRRAETVEKIVAENQKIYHRVYNERIRQAENIRTLSCASPSGLLDDALQVICDTGISGYKQFLETAHTYQQHLHTFTIERDRLDNESPHTVYAWGFGATPNTYSSKPVEFNTFPRYHTLWEKGGLYHEQKLPWMHMLIFCLGNLFMAAVAFIALIRYDPR